MKTTLQEKASLDWTTEVLCTNWFPCLKQWKYRMRKQRWTDNEKNSRKYRMAADEVSNKNEVIDEARKEGKTVHFCFIKGSLSSLEFGVGTKTSKIQGSSCAPRWFSEKWLRLLPSIYRARFFCVTDDSSESNGRYVKATKMRRTSSRRSTSLHPSQNGRCTVIVEESKVRMSRYWDSSTKTQMAEIMVQHGRPSHSSWTKSVRSPLHQDCYGESHSRKFYWNTVGKSYKLGVLICKPRKGTILVCVCGRHEAGWEETKHWPNVETTYETNWFGRTYILPWPRLCRVHSSRVWNKQRITETCLNPGTPLERQKNYLVQGGLDANISTWSYDMEGHAIKCVERHCELANKTTQQLYKVATPCLDDHQFKEEGLGCVGELSKVCFQIVLKCLYMGRIGRPDILWSAKQTCTSSHKVDQSSWQTLCSLDFFCTPHEWL